MSEILKRQLVAQAKRLRGEADQLDALADAISEQGGVAAVVEQGCQHPEDKRMKCPAMGMPNRWMCMVCGHNGGEGPESEQ